MKKRMAGHHCGLHGENIYLEKTLHGWSLLWSPLEK